MNKALFDDYWKQIRSRTTAWWSLITEYDLAKLDKTPDKFEKYITVLRVKYAYTREQAKKEISKHFEESGGIQALDGNDADKPQDKNDQKRKKLSPAKRR
jgi:hypothetical protein